MARYHFLTLFILGTALCAIGCAKKQDNQNQTATVPIHKATLEYASKALLGEGAFWDHQGQRLYWVDIEGRSLHLYHPETKAVRILPLPSRIGTVVPQTDTTAVVALEDGIYMINTINGTLQSISHIESDKPENRFNDGKCDPLGNLWVGSMRKDESRPDAALYKVRPWGETIKMLDSVTISNGIVWSADRKTLYYIDTPTSQIRAFDFDLNTATISNPRVAVQVPVELGFPDGMAIDSRDHLWVGLWNGNAVGCFDPLTGSLIARVEVPAHNVTSCAFGGPDLDKLYITTARVDMTAEEQERFPHAGGIFVAEPGVRGTPSHYFGTPE